jgi:XTP/dITP diphosphohydrolase
LGDVLVVATGNRHKAKEISELLEGLPWSIRCLDDYPALEEPVEDGDTFEANARIKAEYYAAALDLPCVADDSGLSVDALDGRPGVWSARYAGQHGNDDDNNAKVLNELECVPCEKRTARFVCCAAFATPDSDIIVKMGTVEGRIAQACIGDNGFGYDPMFIPDGHDQTFGQLDPSVKRGISHRARAFTKLRDHLMADYETSAI